MNTLLRLQRMYDRKFVLIDDPHGPAWKLSSIEGTNVIFPKYRTTSWMKNGKPLRIASNCPNMLSQLKMVNGSLRDKIICGINKNAFMTNQKEGNFEHLGYINSVSCDEPVFSIGNQENFWDDVTGRP